MKNLLPSNLPSPSQVTFPVMYPATPAHYPEPIPSIQLSYQMLPHPMPELSLDLQKETQLLLKARMAKLEAKLMAWVWSKAPDLEATPPLTSETLEAIRRRFLPLKPEHRMELESLKLTPPRNLSYLMEPVVT